MTARPDPPALLILDMMNLFDFEGGDGLGRAAVTCSRTIRRLRDRFDEAGAPVVYVNDNFAHWQGEFRDLVARCAAGPPAPATIARVLAPEPGHYYVLKPKHSGFLATALPVLLAKLGVRRIVLAGVAADSCILATAQDANMREFGLWVPGDAVAAISADRKARALAVMKASLDADVRGTRTIAGLFP